eukprot:977391-Heterocapsa_arctica.AAC.1
MIAASASPCALSSLSVAAFRASSCHRRNAGECFSMTRCAFCSFLSLRRPDGEGLDDGDLTRKRWGASSGRGGGAACVLAMGRGMGRGGAPAARRASSRAAAERSNAVWICGGR